MTGVPPTNESPETSPFGMPLCKPQSIDTKLSLDGHIQVLKNVHGCANQSKPNMLTCTSWSKSA